MRFASLAVAALVAMFSVVAKGECRVGALRAPLQLSAEALELRGALFALLCAKSPTPLIDGDDADVQPRVVRPQFANADKVKVHDFYPADARERGLQGRIVYLLVVETDGKVSQYARIESSGQDVLDKAALAVLSATRFTPGTLDGAPTRMIVVFPIAFRLPGSRP